MLAIITKMTLTQVSTWFANARRRLKKENKMTWSPRNRSEDGDDIDNDDDVDSSKENGSVLNTSADAVMHGISENSEGEVFIYIISSHIYHTTHSYVPVYTGFASKFQIKNRESYMSAHVYY